MNPEDLNEKLSEAISIVNAMGLRVVSIDADSVVVRIPIAPNTNDKGTLLQVPPTPDSSSPAGPW